ncbi:Fungal specific transcription factor [Ascosphaera aggregata]|nr:Fungal specific transcription factor [Ascosphaera aggregata]
MLNRPNADKLLNGLAQCLMIRDALLEFSSGDRFPSHKTPTGNHNMLNVVSSVSFNCTLTGKENADAADDDSAPTSLSQHTSAPLINRKEQLHQPTFLHATPRMAATNSLAPLPPLVPVTYTSFRNVSACNRCRIRKNRCDQRLPRCHSCEKAKVHCVGYDATTKREVPRSYLFFLESRVNYLQRILAEHGLQVRPATAYEGEGDTVSGQQEKTAGGADTVTPLLGDSQPFRGEIRQLLAAPSAKRKREEDEHNVERSNLTLRNNDVDEHSISGNQRVTDFMSNVGMASIHGTPDPKHVGSTLGITFANVVFAAVKSSISHNSSDTKPFKKEKKEDKPSSSAGNGTMRESFFNLQSKPGVEQAALPSRELGEFLAELYFEHENPQIPILHRGEFMETLARVYKSDEPSRTAKDLYTAFIVFAIGSGVNFGTQSDSRPRSDEHNPSEQQSCRFTPAQPEEYHASAITYLEKCLHISPSGEATGGSLDELQAILLLAGFAILRPVPPGLWYIVGAAMRLAIDLGLHYEDGTGIDAVGGTDLLVRHERMMKNGTAEDCEVLKIDAKERGRREWVRDLRRRLFWSCYILDRLVSTCVNRPFAIPDAVITTELPSALDDKYITREGFLPAPKNAPSYKLSALHYVRLRLLQSEIQQVLHHQQAQIARRTSAKLTDNYLHSDLPCPFLVQHGSFHSWRASIMRRLDEWKDSAPAPEAIGVRFPVEFLELNYWQTVIMLYRQSLTVPEALAREMNTHNDMSTPSVASLDQEEDEEEMHCKVAEAGRKVLRIYRQLHRVRMVNYTYLATHTLFMAGVSFLYAIWHSPTVRSRLTLEEVDLTILAATSVLSDLIQKCPPAEACRDAFNRMSETTVRMCLGRSGFGSQVDLSGKAKRPLSQWGTSTREYNSVTSSEGRYVQKTAMEPSGYDMSQVPPEVGDRGFSTLNSAIPTSSGNQTFPMVQPQRQYRPTPPQRNTPTQQNMVQSRPQVTAYSVAATASGSIAEGLQYQRHHSMAHEYPSLNQHGQSVNQSHSRGRDFPLPSPGSRPDVTYDGSGTTYNEVIDEMCPGLMPCTATAGSPVAPITAPNAYSYGTNNAATMADGAYTFPALVDNSGATGVDLGFGLAVDYQHDWSEGVGLDLLDGYFFGGNPS